MKFMFSFTRGKPIAIALDSDGNKVFIIHITEEEEMPDIKVDEADKLDMINTSDIGQIVRAMKLGKIERTMLEKSIKTGDDIHLNDKLKRARNILLDSVQEKLKREISFSKGDNVKKILPLIGENDDYYDRPFYVVGASGCGKTYLCKEICKYDTKKRPVVIFSKVDDDPSLKDLKKLKTPEDKKSRFIKIPIHTIDDLTNLPPDTDLQKTICLFDDIDSFTEREGIADYLRDYRDNLLETGRHCQVTCLCTSHLLHNYKSTRKMCSESEYIATFPNSNKRFSHLMLKDHMGLDVHERRFFVEKAQADGRFLIAKLSNPNMIITERSIMMV